MTENHEGMKCYTLIGHRLCTALYASIGQAHYTTKHDVQLWTSLAHDEPHFTDNALITRS